MKKLLYVFMQVGLFGQVMSQNYCTTASLPAVLQTSLVAYYPFCGNANDVSGNNYNGVVTSASLTTDRFGNASSAYDFNGTNARILTSTPFFNNSWNDYTISFWMNTANTSKLEQCCFNTLPHNSMALGYNYTGSMQNHVHFSLNTDPSVQTWDMVLGAQGTYTSYVANQWYHIVLVKIGTVWKQYINGANDGAFSSGAAITNTLTNIIIGAILNPATSNYDQFFQGKLDDYMIYNRALNSSEIQMLYCMPPSDPGPLSGAVQACSGIAGIYSVAPVNGATSYSWVVPGNWTGTSTTNVISATPGVSGVFNMEAINSCGKSGAVTLTVAVNTAPTVTATTSTTMLCNGQNALLSAGGASTYVWNPGGGIGANVSVNPTVTTTYTVTGTLNGCQNTATLVQNVMDCSTTLLENSQNNRSVIILPNPNNGNFAIDCAECGMDAEITVTDIAGKEIFTKKLEKKEHFRIETKGIYFVRIKNEPKGFSGVYKLIVD